MLAERGLERAKFAALGKPFDRADVATLRLRREHEAGSHRRAIDNYRAGAADAVLAPEMRAGEFELLAQTVRKACTSLDCDLDCGTVHRECGLNRFHDAAHNWAN